MNKGQKEQVIEELNQAFSSSTSLCLVDFGGIDVADETELRRMLTDSGCGYRVVKNRLALRAAVDTPLDRVREHFRGPTAVAFNREDPVGLARALTGFVKAHPNISLKVGVLETSVLSAGDIEELATMPPREELISRLAFLLLAPVRNLASALQAPLRNLASVLSQLEDSGKKTN